MEQTDEEEDAHRGEEHQEGRTLLVREGRMEAIEADAHLRVRVRVLALETGRDRAHLLRGALEGDRGPQPRDVSR